jgi:hypothetical protein
VANAKASLSLSLSLSLEAIELVAQGLGSRGIVGAIQQQGKASKLAPLQPPGPAGRRQTPLDGLGGKGPPQSVQGFGHRHRHRRVAALQIACQAQAGAPLRF